MSDEWISAASALQLVAEALGNQHEARLAICSRAYEGLINAKAVRYVAGNGRTLADSKIPRDFWRDRGPSRLAQNWPAGDFERSIGTFGVEKAFGVSFSREGIESLVRPALTIRNSRARFPQTTTGGRPPAAWWDDLWVEIARQLYDGDLKPKTQADIETAMKDWAATYGESPADSTIRPRARKLWTALNKNGKN
jgi:hypothetical protein